MSRVLRSPIHFLERRARRFSLRTKGVLALGFFLACILLTGLLVAHERQGLVAIVGQVEAAQAGQAMLSSALNPLSRSLVQTQAALDALDAGNARGHAYEPLAEHIRPALPGLAQAARSDPRLQQEVGRFMMAVTALRASVGREELAELRDREQALIAKLHEAADSLGTRIGELTQQYRDSQRTITVVIVSAHVIGAGGGLAMILVFFTRMSKDIARLQARATAVVAGYDGPPLDNRRGDEIGGLIDAVNRMQVDLRRSEQRRELSRRQRFHQEKMAAVGSLAAAIGHEVRNPLAAISGVAQFMVEETRADAVPNTRVLGELAAEIVRHARRTDLILQQMATLTTAPSAEPRLLDVNALIRSTAGFVSYDKRLREVEFELALDPALPAVVAVADHFTQILMNLLINAADAMEPAKGARRVRIATRCGPGGVEVSVGDNGRGMTPEVLAKAFDESFTTKPAGRGRGIGLFLCKTLMEEAGGRITLESTPDVGTTATLFLPTPEAPPRA